MKIEWKGGERPVSWDTKVRTWWNDTNAVLEAEAGDFRWDYDENEASIISYEVIEEPKKTLRDEFAMFAMQAYINSLTEEQEPIEHATGICEHSYLFADAMMKARAK